MIALTQITNTEIFAFVAVLVFKFLSCKVLFINRKDNRSCWKVDYSCLKKEISRENYSKIVGTWNFHRTFETRKWSFISAFAICMIVPIKQVKLIVFENYNECKTKHLLWLKKVLARFDKKTTWRKKSIVEEKNLLLRALKKKTLSLRTQRRPYHWGP